MRHEVVPAACHGTRLPDFLSRRWPEVDRVFLRRLVVDEEISVNGATAGPRHRLREGDVLTLPAAVGALPKHVSGTTTAPVVEILHAGSDFVVAFKPAGMPCAPDRLGKTPGVLSELAALDPGTSHSLVHRLDRDASGCLLVARSNVARDRLDAAFVAGDLEVEAVALVVGRARFAERDVEAYLGPDPRWPGKIRTVAAGSKGARAAHTVCSRRERFHDHTLLHVRPVTLRAHQVRVHLLFSGHPIVCDPAYGIRRELRLSEIKKNYKSRPGVVERPLLTRMFLHFARVRVPDPVGGAVDVSAPLPPDLDRVLAKLRHFAALQ